eukprot:67002_1
MAGVPDVHAPAGIAYYLAPPTTTDGESARVGAVTVVGAWGAEFDVGALMEANVAEVRAFDMSGGLVVCGDAITMGDVSDVPTTTVIAYYSAAAPATTGGESARVGAVTVVGAWGAEFDVGALMEANVAEVRAFDMSGGLVVCGDAITMGDVSDVPTTTVIAYYSAAAPATTGGESARVG